MKHSLLTGRVALLSALSGALLLCPVLPAAGQTIERDRGRPRDGSLPRDVSRSLAASWNAPGTKRARGPFTLSPGDTVRGDLAILDGPATIGGVVTGQVVAINSDVVLESTARIAGDVTVVGGVLDGRSRGDVSGEIRVWRARLRFHEEADQLVPEPERVAEARWQQWRRRDDSQGAWGRLFITSAHTYNRVEGLPVFIGPRLRTRHGPTRVSIDMFGLFRTGDNLSWEPDNLGHRLWGEFRQGRRSGFAIGANGFNEVAPVERWALTDNEVGLASAFFTRDFRDYYQRHGGNGYVSLFGPVGTSLTVSVGEERWGSRDARNPWSLVNHKDQWRTNPEADAGKMKLVTVAGLVDTRNDDGHPRSGWFLDAQYERGTGTLTSVAPTSPGTRNTVPGAITYSRLMVDMRRYNRLAPNTQLNMRVVAGGALEGDPLPAQRRFSVSGADALPGFDFRSKIGGSDVGTCASGSDLDYAALGRPAQCDRMLLLQLEWKSDFHLGIFGDDDDRWFDHRIHADGNWVVFMNSGRGWLVGANDGILHYPKDALPAIGTWRTDIGGGFDFGNFGVYIAQAVSENGPKPNVFIRLGRRF